MKFFATTIALIGSSFVAIAMASKQDEVELNRNLANLFSESAKPKRDVSLTISTSKASFASDEPVLLEVTLENKELNKPARILDWLVPCEDAEDDSSPETPTEMSFFGIKTAGGHVASYLGAVFKRGKPDEKDYKILKPGEKISCTIDLAKYYAFTSNDDDNSYKIKYSVMSMELSNPNASTGASALESLASNTITIKIEARDVPTRALRERKLQGSNNFSGDKCDLTKRNDLIEARRLATIASNETVSFIENNPQTCPRYKKWFGTYADSRHTELMNGYRLTRDRFADAPITFDCGCKKQYYAYVYINQPYKIYLCAVFWRVAMNGTDSKMGTLIHEMTHFVITADTDDYAYGQTNCKNLAINNPGQAVNNADNHEYAAENTPFLSC